MATQESLDITYMKMAETLSQLSCAKRKKVGAIIVKGTQIISEGYNGTPNGFDNVCEFSDWVGQLRTKPEVLHAESNAITKLAKSTNSSSDSILYVTLAPCFNCCKLIIQSGIKKVIFKEDRRANGLDILHKAGVEFQQIT